jgi:L-alanine-DL-glutamate epimerase-like enolase superfamily enzyme
MPKDRRPIGRRGLLKTSAALWDISTSGGILETHDIGDAAMEYGAPMAMHYAGLPIGALAGVHCNEDVVRRHLVPDTDYFDSTPKWDKESSWDRLRSMTLKEALGGGS